MDAHSALHICTEDRVHCTQTLIFRRRTRLLVPNSKNEIKKKRKELLLYVDWTHGEWKKSKIYYISS